MNPFDKQAPVRGIKNIIAVGSGKGGVGKSTVSANIALALASLHQRVGLLDADLFGPSVPRLFGLVNQRPQITPDGKIQPHERYGIKLMSMGFLVGEESALIWRGPMLFKALEQLLRDVAWGELDYLIVDLPPGTGDVPLTLAQKVPLTGAMAVTTPQNLALSDCKKSIDMFCKLNIPFLGLIENMSYFESESGNYPLFPKGDLEKYLEENKILRLAQIPFVPALAEASEKGISLFETHKNSLVVEKFKVVAQKIIEAKTHREFTELTF